jgi:hypothetical protein
MAEKKNSQPQLRGYIQLVAKNKGNENFPNVLDNTYHIIFLNVIEFNHNSELSLERSFRTMRKL